jgi:hypothetical protein
MSSKRTWLKLTGIIAPLTIAAVFSACGDDDNSKPEGPPVFGTGGKKTDGGDDTGGKSSGSGGKSSGSGGSGGSENEPDASSGGDENGTGGASPGTGGSSSGTGGAASSGGTGNGPDSGLPQCKPGDTGTDGCFKCPQSTTEFLNQCTDSNCAPFNNAQRLPRFNGYPLPELGT